MRVMEETGMSDNRPMMLQMNETEVREQYIQKVEQKWKEREDEREGEGAPTGKLGRISRRVQRWRCEAGEPARWPTHGQWAMRRSWRF